MEHGYGVGSASFGLVSFGVIAALAVIAMTAIGVARRPRWRRVFRYVGNVAAVRRVSDWTTARLGAPTSSLRSRLRLQGIAGVALIAGLVVVTLMAVGFTDLLDDVLEGDGVAVVDHPSARWLAQHRDLWLTNVLVPVTHWGGPAGQTVLLVVVCALAAVRGRSWLPVLLGVVGGGGITAVVLIAKHLVGRPRPPSPFALIPAPGFSFPSGHATGAAAIGLLCAWILCRWVVRRWSAQVAVWAATSAAIALIGFSRLYLGVHFVTDVLAGWLLGAAWTGVVVLAGSWSAVRHPSD
ncbi:phosphatase PAP2 family protein [Mycolicibacterium aichiense]|uniref:phosphatase PAP2 family protein n=1 Tax=Mycolicibacterium aichiense TaxID=1799 RepID=UPI003D666679